MNPQTKAQIESTVRALVMMAVGLGWVKIKDQGTTDAVIYAGVSAAVLIASLWWSKASDANLKGQ